MTSEWTEKPSTMVGLSAAPPRGPIGRPVDAAAVAGLGDSVAGPRRKLLINKRSFWGSQARIGQDEAFDVWPPELVIRV